MNVIVPMAGRGSRLKDGIFTQPKPFIEIKGKTMIEWAISSLKINATYTFIVLEEHLNNKLEGIFERMHIKYNIVTAKQVTQGPACTVLLAKEIINNEEPLIISNCDHYIDWESKGFIEKCNKEKNHGEIAIFYSSDAKYSFCRVNEKYLVTEVVEKVPVSNLATAGIYYWKYGKDFVNCAERMIEQNKRVNNEFYVAPVYNEIINKGGKVGTFEVKKMWGLGTPDEIYEFLTL
jgi:dTDP-glucose pyrophosphorylase